MKNSKALLDNLKPVRIVTEGLRLFTKPARCLTAVRPKTLPAGLSPVIAGLAVAATYTKLNAAAALCTFISTAAMQISANLINDYLDFIKGHDTGKRLGPERVVQSGLMNAYEIQFLTALFLAAAVFSGFFLVIKAGICIFIIGLLSISAAAAYSLFTKPLGFLGGGEASAFIFFGPVAVSGTFFIQTGFFSPELLFTGFSIGLYSLALLTVNNYRDIEEDRLTGKISIPARFGKPAAVAGYSGVLSAPFIGPLFMVFSAGFHPVFLLPVLSLIPGIVLFKRFIQSKPDRELNSLLFFTSITMIFHSLMYAGASALYA